MGIFGNKYRYLFILLLAGYSYANAGFSEVRNYYPIPGTQVELFIYFVLLTTLIWEGSHGIDSIFARRKTGTKPAYSWEKKLAVRFVCSLVYSSTVSAVSSYLLSSVFFQMPPGGRPIIVKLSVTLGTRINLFLQVVNAIVFFLARIREKEKEAGELRRVKAQAELQAIRNQVNPHFLFNNLNVLSALVLKERPEAARFIEAFATVYRQVLNAQQKDTVPLAEELALLDDYLFLLRQRFPESIEIDIDVDPGYREHRIVPLALQMLIENAVKHNMATKESPLRLTVRTGPGDILLVENNLQPRSTIEPSSRIGLLNIDQRYRLLCGEHINRNRTESRFSVTLPLLPP